MTVMVLDVEATGKCNEAKVYDLGAIVLDTHTGQTLARVNFVIEDIFFDNSLMRTAYYADKIPIYYEDLREGKRELCSFHYARTVILTLCKAYKVSGIWAYNALYDMNALNYTSKMLLDTEFIPQDMKVRFKCIMGAFMSTIGNTCKYAKCADRTEKGSIKCSAETAYRYITGMAEFVEEHTGLADAEIEAIILMKCLKRKQKMDTVPKSLFAFKSYRLIQSRR